MLSQARNKARSIQDVLAFLTLALFSSCAGNLYGPVLAKNGGFEVEVCLDDESMNAMGKPVRLVRESCRPSTSLESPVVPGPASFCQKNDVARGKIAQLLGKGRAIAHFPAGTPIEPGDRVEQE